jgi:thiol:disulfide interchange protein DsbD
MSMTTLARRLFRWSFPLAMAAAALCGTAHAADDFLEAQQAFRGAARMLDGRTLEVRFDIAPGYHMYRERISAERDSGDARIGALELPAGEREFDATFNKEVETYRGTMVAQLPVEAVTGDLVRIRVNHQGCADAGLCYAPQTSLADLRIEGGTVKTVTWLADADAAGATDASAAPNSSSVMQPAAPAAQPAVAAAVPAPEGNDSGRVAAALHSGSLLTIAGVFLIAGLLLSFTPCVLPMVPILSSIIVGQGAPVTRARGFSLALAYALGMALVYTGFGVVAGLLGEGLAAALQNPWVLGAFALLLAGLSLSMFGVYELQLPGGLQSRVSAVSGRLPGGRFAGVFAMGGLSALIVGPCVAAPLAGALVYISQTKDVVIGGLALFSLAMGMSVPLLLVGLSAGSLLPRAGGWMEGVKTVFGVMLLAVALWIVSPVLPGWALMLIIGTGLLVGAAYLKLFDRLGESATGRHRLAKGTALVLAVLGTTQVVGALSGGNNPVQPLRHLARASSPGDAGAVTAAQKTEFKRIRNVAELDEALKTTNRPVVVDFYADWCVSCKEMEHLTFSDPSVRARMGGALLLQADVTENTADDKALMKRFGLFGPPGILFFDTNGQEHTQARVIGFLPPQRFAASLTVAGL